MYGQLYSGGGEDKLGPGVFIHGEGLVEGPSEGLKVGGVRHCWCSLGGNCEEIALWTFTEAQKPRGRRQLDSQRTRAAMSEKVAAIAGASGWGTGERRGAMKCLCVLGREGGPFLTGGAAALTTCWGKKSLEVFFVLLSELAPEAA